VAEVLGRVASLYAIAAEIRGQPAECRRQVGQQRSRPIVEALPDWLHNHIDKVSGASDLAKAMRCALRHWPGLIAFLDDGRIEMDSNTVARRARALNLIDDERRYTAVRDLVAGTRARARSEQLYGSS